MELIPLITAIASGVVGIAGTIITWRKVIADRKAGVATDEREQRRDTIADRDALIDQLQDDMRDLRDRMSVLEVEYQIERDWNRMLVDHIYRGEKPPPPARPFPRR